MTETTRRPVPYHRMDGPADGVPLVLGPSLGTSLAVWEPQLAGLTARHRVLRFDLPGHGGSRAVPAPPGGVAGLADQVLRLADAAGWERFRYAGISLGGAVGLQLAARHPDRIAALAVLCSSAHFGDPAAWRQRAATVTEEGTEALVSSRPGTWFAPGFERTPRGAALLADLRATDAAGYAACCRALADYALGAEDLAGITAPTLVLAGRDDPATPPGHARELADAIPNAGLVEIPRAAHLANVERPEPVLAALLGHLTATTEPSPVPVPVPVPPGELPGDDAARRRAGTEVRRAVLGDRHVDRATAGRTAFTAPFQDFITRYAWGEIWTRPGLSRHTRSCVTLTALVAGGHLDELALHVRAALRNGLTAEEISEVLLQTAVYCGVPAANAAFAVADRVLREAGDPAADNHRQEDDA